MRKKLIKTGFLCALGEGVYIGLVVLLINTLGHFLGDTPDNKILAPLTFLLLFVLSASVSGALVLGKPVMMYLEGKKKEAVQLFGLTVFWLFIFFILTLASLFIFR